MKRHIRFSTIAFSILALLLATFPASAGAIKTEVTGKVIPLTSGEIPEKYWETDNLILHARHEHQEYKFETSDSRLNGWGFGDVSWEVFWNPDGTLIAIHIRGPIVITDDPEGQHIIWDCSSNAKVDAQWYFDSKVVCNGRGVNDGLLAKFTLTGAEYDLQGVIIDPGGE
jgi:hypothetical protein